jgi:hypothetical protein
MEGVIAKAEALTAMIAGEVDLKRIIAGVEALPAADDVSGLAGSLVIRGYDAGTGDTRAA